MNLFETENISNEQRTKVSAERCVRQINLLSKKSYFKKNFTKILLSQNWFSSACTLTWKMRSTMNREKKVRYYFYLFSAPHDKNYLLRTPSANEPGVSVDRLETKDGSPAKIGERAYDKITGKLKQVGLPQQIKMLLPTPVVMDSNQGNLEKIDKRRAKAKAKGYNGNGFAMTLGEMFSRGLLPTPVSRNYITGSRKITTHLQNKIDNKWTVELNDLATLGMLPSKENKKNDAKTVGQLSPFFVAEMMGYDPMYVLQPFLKK